MTEHSASVFVFFFLAEYASIILICVLNSILFFGGYLCIIPVEFLIDIFYSLFGINNSILEEIFVNFSSSPLNLAFKTAFLIFVFI
jgi:NADH-ubiquinone oxidoreductase chain 1